MSTNDALYGLDVHLAPLGFFQDLILLLREGVSTQKEVLSKLQTACLIHGENLNGCSSDGSETLYSQFMNSEMVRPTVSPRVVQMGEFSSKRVNAAQIWPFAQIASVTCQSEIGIFARAIVLPRDYVLDVKDQVAIRLP